MPGIDTHRNIAAAVSQRLENAGSARHEGNEAQGKIRLADCVVGQPQPWKNAKVPSARKAPTRATTAPGERHHDEHRRRHNVQAVEADAMSNTPARGEESEARKSDTFGIDAHRLNADLVSGTKRFLNHYGHAKKR